MAVEVVVEDAPKRGTGAGVVEGATLLATVDTGAPLAIPGNSVDAARFLLPLNPPKLAVGFTAGAAEVVVVAMVTAGLAPNAVLAPAMPKGGLKVGTVGLLSWAGGGAVEAGGVTMKMGLKPDTRRGLAALPAVDVALEAVSKAAVPNRLVPDIMDAALAAGFVAWFSTWVKAEAVLLLGCPRTEEMDWGSWEELKEGGGFCGVVSPGDDTKNEQRKLDSDRN